MDQFIDAYVKALTRYADFATRTSVGDFWRFVATNFAIGVLLGILAQVSSFFYVIYAIYALALIIPGIAAGVRRLHDTSKSGWFLLLGLIPVVGLIILIVFWVQPSDGPNEWGHAAT
jgi:uncharacterized membrane protein YhaH (DUF805 family)